MTERSGTACLPRTDRRSAHLDPASHEIAARIGREQRVALWRVLREACRLLDQEAQKEGFEISGED